MFTRFKKQRLIYLLVLLTFVVSSYLTGFSNIPIAFAAPAAPTDLTAVSASATSIRLDWQDNINGAGTTYYVQRSLSATSGFVTVSPGISFPVKTWTNAGLTTGTTYYFWVIASNNGYSPHSNVASAIPGGAPTAPAAPSNLTATASTAYTVDVTSVHLTWTDNSTNETGFKITRTNPDNSTTNLTSGANTTSYDDSNLIPNGSYSYKIAATNSVGDSAYTNPTSVTTKAAINFGELGFIHDIGDVNSVTIVGNTAYIASEQFGLAIVDITNPAQLKLTGVLDSLNKGQTVYLVDNNHAILSTHGGLRAMIDISDPTKPVVASGVQMPSTTGIVHAIVNGFDYGIGFNNTGDFFMFIDNISDPNNITQASTLNLPMPGQPAVNAEPLDIAVSGNIAVVIGNQGTANVVFVVDISNKTSPKIIGTLPVNGSISSVAISGSIAVVTSGDIGGGKGGGIDLIDISIPSAPNLKSSLAINGSTNLNFGIAAQSNLVSVSVKNTINLVDIADTANPKVVGTYQHGGSILASTFSGSKLFTAERYYGMEVLDISTPQTPTLISSIVQQLAPSKITTSGNKAILIDKENLKIADISNPVNPQIVSTFAVPKIADLAIYGNLVYIITANDLEVFSLATPTTPPTITSLSISSSNLNHIEIYGDYAFISAIYQGTQGIYAVNIKNPSSLSVAGSFPMTYAPFRIAVTNNLLLTLKDIGGGGEIKVIDKSNPASLVLKATTNITTATDMVVDGSYAYITTGNGDGIKIMNLTNPASPTIASTYKPGNSTVPSYTIDELEGIAVAYFSPSNGLYSVMAIDVSNPVAPTDLSMSQMTFGWVVDIHIGADKKVYMADYGGVNVFGLYADKIIVTKTASVSIAKSGDTITYTLKIENTSPNVLTNLSLTDAIPAGTAYVVNSATVNGQAVTDAADSDAYKLNSGVPTWTFSTIAPSGQTGSIITATFQVRIL